MIAKNSHTFISGHQHSTGPATSPNPYLWGFTVRLESQDNDGRVSLIAERMREKRTGHAATGP